MAKKKKKLLKGLRGPSYFIGGIIAGFGAKKRAKEGEAKAREAMAAAAAQREAEKANRQTLALSPEVEKLKEGLGGDEIQRRQELKMLYEEELKRAMEDNREKVNMIIKPDLRYNI